MKTKTITKWVLIVSLSVILIWDIYVQLTTGLKDTVSWQIWEFSRGAPFLPFLAGFVMGHLFWGDPFIPEKWLEKKIEKLRKKIEKLRK